MSKMKVSLLPKGVGQALALGSRPSHPLKQDYEPQAQGNSSLITATQAGLGLAGATDSPASACRVKTGIGAHTQML